MHKSKSACGLRRDPSIEYVMSATTPDLQRSARKLLRDKALLALLFVLIGCVTLVLLRYRHFAQDSADRLFIGSIFCFGFAGGTLLFGYLRYRGARKRLGS